MNREILFRGKRVDNGEWIESRSILQFDYGAVYLNYRGSWVEVIPETVGQYTGIDDKNGKKIFEGDIVRYDDQYFVVRYIDGFAAYALREFNNMTSYIPAITPNTTPRMDVIGNIHDNADLLDEVQG